MKKILNLIIILSLLATIPYIYQRANAEVSNQSYEIIVPHQEIKALTDAGLSQEEIYATLAEDNQYGVQRVQAISFEPITLANLINQGAVNVLEREGVSALIKEEDALKLPEDTGLYIVFKEDNKFVRDSFLQAFRERVEKMNVSTIEGEAIYFVSGFPDKLISVGETLIENAILSRPITYDIPAIEQAYELGFEIVFRISNDINEQTTFIIDQMIDLKETYNAENILFSGNEVLGFANEDVAPHYIGKLNDAKFNIMQIELFKQKGFPIYEKKFENRFIRLLSIDPFDGWEGHVDRAVRAINERNIRAIFFHIAHNKKLYNETLKPDEMLEKATGMIDDVHHRIMNQKFADYVPEGAGLFNKLDSSLLITLIALVGAVAFMARVALVATPILSWLVLAGGALLTLAYAVLQMSIIVQAVALGASVVAATYAVIHAEAIRNSKDIWKYYLTAAGIGLIGAWFVTALLFGNEYMLKFVEFRGVKVLYLLPILLVTAHFLRDNAKTIAVSPVRYIELALLGVGMVAVLIYLMRSGNDPGVAVSGMELQIRQLLEDTLGIRPRTKEFLIGLPLFILGMYLVSKGYRYAKFIYIGAAVGFVSMVNTFTHLHIPLYISFIRTIYGLIFGAIIGLILIACFKVIEKFWPKIRARFE
ncbi:DUF5693 family protein [Bacillus solimangrovi]|uniref:Uncharacterized protein n=1 Tax=Bacillus solimangrovi TaxID=1305675 RepID=A0A1E5LDN4_9BACI|nr:DUF5693 family protein [Bacillus solimangrovi]OEH92182.1 hypothetical protein BFG57_02615 [Bacillus solimangrovi]